MQGTAQSKMRDNLPENASTGARRASVLILLGLKGGASYSTAGNKGSMT